MDKASDETINKKCAEYKQLQLIEKGEKTGKALGKHVIILYSTGISRWLKIKDVRKLRQDIENDPIIKDQMANLGCLFVCTFGDYLAPVLIAAHTANNLDFGDELENEGYESNLKKPYFYPHSVSKGINKMNLFDRILRDIFWHTLEYILGFQEKFNKRVRRDPH